MTEINTVTIPLRRYNELRDFEGAIHENKYVIPHEENYYRDSYYEYLSKEEFEGRILEIHERELKEKELENVKLNNEILRLSTKIMKLEKKKWWKRLFN